MPWFRRFVMVAAVGLLLQVTAAQDDTTDASALAALLPEAPSGWTSKDGQVVDHQAAGIDVASVSRVYNGSDGVEVELTIVGSPAMVMAAQGAATMFQNPMMLQQMNAADPAKQFAAVDREGWSGWTMVDGTGGASEATAFNNQLVVKIEIDRADAALLADFIDRVPWSDLAALHE